MSNSQSKTIPYNELLIRAFKFAKFIFHVNRVAEKKAEAAAAISLMHETYLKIASEERSRGGLVILSATYGALVQGGGSPAQPNVDQEILDVTVPVQCLVRDSRLDLHETTKVNIPGFYDPAPGEDKTLLIRYLFQNREHQVIIQDNEAIQLPKSSKNFF